MTGCQNPDGRLACDAEMCRMFSDLIQPDACYEARPDDGDQDYES